MTHRPHFPTIEVDNVRTHFVNEAEFQAIHKNLPPHVQPIVKFLFLTAWRVGEALQLEWPDVEFKAGVVRLRPGTTKNREARVFPFSALPELEALLRRQREHTDAVEKATHQIVRHVFHRDGIAIKDFRGAWRSACRKAGLPHLWIHDLRRSGVRRLIRSGIPRLIAKKITGHKTDSTFDRYGIMDEDVIKEAVQKVAVFREKERDERQVVPIGHSLATIQGQTASSGSEGS